MIQAESITTNQALEILQSTEMAYVPKGHTLLIYSSPELMGAYMPILGGAIVALGIVWLLMRVFRIGRERYG